MKLCYWLFGKQGHHKKILCIEIWILVIAITVVSCILVLILDGFQWNVTVKSSMTSIWYGDKDKYFKILAIEFCFLKNSSIKSDLFVILFFVK